LLASLDQGSSLKQQQNITRVRRHPHRGLTESLRLHPAQTPDVLLREKFLMKPPAGFRYPSEEP
jgi:hypothetical protein